MGGRGATSILAGNLAKIKTEVISAYWIQENLRYSDVDKLIKSPTFMSNLQDEIGKQAFNNGYEITTREVSRLMDESINEMKSQQEKDNAAKEYFKRTYNPNREQREITSSTYERAQRRLNSEVESFLGIKKKRKR